MHTSPSAVHNEKRDSLAVGRTAWASLATVLAVAVVAEVTAAVAVAVALGWRGREPY